MAPLGQLYHHSQQPASKNRSGLFAPCFAFFFPPPSEQLLNAHRVISILRSYADTQLTENTGGQAEKAEGQVIAR